MKKFKRRFMIGLIAVAVVAVIVGALVVLAAIEKANAIKVDVSSSKFSPGISQGFVKASSYKFVVVTFSVSNHSSKPLAVDPIKQSYVTDGAGARYAAAPINLDNEFKSTSVGANGSHTGQMSYAVPSDVSKLSLHVDLSADYAFKLNLSPSS